MNPELLCMGCMEDRGGAETCPHCGWREHTAPEGPHQLSPRTVLQDQYLIGRALGHGGFAITYLAWDINLTRKLAVKEFLPTGVATRALNSTTVTPYSGQAKTDFEYGLEKFLEEARVLARFQNHPGIISVLNFFRANGTAYLVMEYLEGTTLKEFLAANGDRISFDTAVQLMIPVMDALREVHREGILHRDISPDNIYMTRAGQMKVLDFGAARYALSDRSQNLSIILKTGYAPEEQYRSKGKQGPWTDVYAVGATIYRAITGNVPPPAPDRLDQDEIERPSLAGIAIDGRSENALMKALAVRAANRYQSMEDLQAAFAPAPNFDGATRIIKPGEIEPRDDETPVPVPPTPDPRPIPWTRWLWTGGVVLGLLFAVALAVEFGKPVPEEKKIEPIAAQKEEPAAVQKAPPPNTPKADIVPTAAPNVVGTWRTVINDGFRTWNCLSENFSNGEYRFAPSCPPPFANERGRTELGADGTWKLKSHAGRMDYGTYRVINQDQLEMTGLLGTAVWTRVPPASNRQVSPATNVRDRSNAPPSSPPVRDDRQTREAQRRAQLERDRRRQEDLAERQRQAQIEQQRRQQEFQQQQRQSQQEQLIQDGAKALQQLLRR